MTDHGAADDWREFDDWVAELEKSGAGRLLLTNFKYDCLTRRPSPEILLDILQQMRVALRARHGELNGMKSDSVAGLVIGELASIIQARRAEYVLRNSGEVATVDRWARVLQGDRFMRRHVNPGVIGHSEDGTAVTADLIRETIQKPDWSSNSEISGRDGIAWATPLTDLESRVDLRQTPPAFTGLDAALIRSTLGLSHFKSGDVVVVVVYPEGGDVATQAMAPTVVEGGCNPVYRSDRSGDGCGYAIDLATWRRGGREAVHRPVRLTRRFEPIPIAVLLDDVAEIDHDELLAGIQEDERWQRGIDTVADLVGKLRS